MEALLPFITSQIYNFGSKAFQKVSDYAFSRAHMAQVPISGEKIHLSYYDKQDVESGRKLFSETSQAIKRAILETGEVYEPPNRLRYRVYHTLSNVGDNNQGESLKYIQPFGLDVKSLDGFIGKVTQTTGNTAVDVQRPLGWFCVEQEILMRNAVNSAVNVDVFILYPRRDYAAGSTSTDPDYFRALNPTAISNLSNFVSPPADTVGTITAVDYKDVDMSPYEFPAITDQFIIKPAERLRIPIGGSVSFKLGIGTRWFNKNDYGLTTSGTFDGNYCYVKDLQGPSIYLQIYGDLVHEEKVGVVTTNKVNYSTVALDVLRTYNIYYPTINTKTTSYNIRNGLWQTGSDVTSYNQMANADAFSWFPSAAPSESAPGV